MATFQNQATLLFGGERINSNTTVGEIVDVVGITKTAISVSYGQGDAIAYAVSIENRGTAALTGLTLTDNLGSFIAPGGSDAVPLEYAPGTLNYYVNGELLAPPTVTAGQNLVISGISVPAGGNALLVYEATANGYAPLAAGSSITNVATLDGATAAPLTDAASVPVREAAELSITKTVNPDTISGGGEITYSFIIQNSGNTPVLATDSLVITDTFTPVLSNITVEVNGAAIAEGTGYTYDEATGTFATVSGAITVPQASYETLPDGAVAVTPGVTVVTVSGTI